MTYLIDIDDTLLIYPDTDKPYQERGAQERYKYAMPNQEEIERLHVLIQDHEIILFTGRGWHQRRLTETQMKLYNIPYDGLIMGIPPGIKVDRDSVKSLKEIL